MIDKIHNSEFDRKRLEELSIDCKNCRGICCVDLFFAKMDGFPADKCAGKACQFLGEDCRCLIHEELSKRKLHGCQTYDCIGAGQRVAGMFPAEEKQENMEEIFHKMFLLHEMLWYLTEACSITVDEKKKEMIKIMMDEIDLIRELEAKVFLKRNLDELKQKVDRYLKDVSKEVMERFPIARKKEKQMDYMGKNLKGKDLSGMDFSMSFLIAANLSNTNLTGTNFLGADMRDTNISGADLRESVFLTQMQVNGAKGDEKTLLPRWIKRPSTW